MTLSLATLLLFFFSHALAVCRHMPLGLLPQQQLLRAKSRWLNKTSDSAGREHLPSGLLPIW
jgi:hypothetical protein